MKDKKEPPREKFKRLGADALSKVELLAIILGSGIRGMSVFDLSKLIIEKFGHKLLDLTIEDLKIIKGIGDAKAKQIISALTLGKRCHEEKYNTKDFIEGLKKKKGITYDQEKFLNNFAQIAEDGEYTLFDFFNVEIPQKETTISEITEYKYYLPHKNNKYFQLQNRRYIGSKQKLINWIFSIIKQECKGRAFVDVFAGTGIVSAVATKEFENIIMNDFLFSNNIIYNAFFKNDNFSQRKIDEIIKEYNNLNSEDLEENYFSKKFGGKFFSNHSAKKIGFIRENIEINKKNLKGKEYSILIASLIYSIDKIANTVGHYDAYFKKENLKDNFFMKSIEATNVKGISIYREDANFLAKNIKADIAYIDPPYNSRQYSRFYHILETLAKWDCPPLYGVALKPKPENMSDYCRVQAKNKFSDLIYNLDVKYLVVSYNNTYKSKSKSSKNKITLEEIEEILKSKGRTKIFKKNHQCFNSGNTDFDDHKEYLFVTEVKK